MLADRDRNHQRWQNLHTFVDWRIELEIEPDRRSHLDLGIDQGIAEWASGQLTEVLVVEAFHHIEESRRMEFPGNLRGFELVGCSPVEIHRSQVGQVPCPYPTESELD